MSKTPASGTSAFQLAVQALRAGACDIALALGAEKMNIEDKMRALALFEGGWDVLTADENAARLLSLSRRDHTVVSWPSIERSARISRLYAHLPASTGRGQ